MASLPQRGRNAYILSMDEPKSKTRSFVQSYAQASQYIGAGIQLAVSIFLCLLGGAWLDRQIDTSPLFLILGTFLGAVAGFYSLYKIATSAERQRKKEKGACGKG